MNIFNESGCAFAWTRSPKGTTFVVKGTFELRPDGLVLSEDQPTPAGDRFIEDDPSRALLAPSELAPWKPRADLLLTATCQSKKPVTVLRVGFSVGSYTKRLVVFGDRLWVGRLPSDPCPFTKMPLGLSRSFGGPGYAKNPWGVGCDDGRLPNLEPVGKLVTSPSDRPEPAGFGAIHPAHRQNRPNVAPEDQQFCGYLQGDETLTFENLGPITSAKLPGLRMRAVFEKTEVPMNLDTLHVDLDASRIVLVWRGALDVAPVGRALIVAESMAEPRRELRIPAEVAVPSAPPSGELPRDLRGADLAGADLRKADLHAADLRGAKLTNAKLAGADLTNAVLVDADLTGVEASTAILVGADLSRACLRKADLERADLSRSVLDGADLSDARLVETCLEQVSGRDLVAIRADLRLAKCAGANLPRAILRKAIACHSIWKGARLDGADLTEAEFAGAKMDGVSLIRSLLAKCSLRSAWLAKAILRGIRATRVNLFRALLTEADLRGADLRESNLFQADLVGADVSDALLAGANVKRTILEAA